MDAFVRDAAEPLQTVRVNEGRPANPDVFKVKHKRLESVLHECPVYRVGPQQTRADGSLRLHAGVIGESG